MEQGTDEWFDIKLGKLSASHAQAIATNGKGLDTLCFKLAGERISGTREEFYTNEDMERGIDNEQFALDQYELDTGCNIEKVGFVELNKYVGCSPDGLVNKDGLVEIKCPNFGNFIKGMYLDEVDSKYIWQAQMQMYVTGRKWCDIVRYNENFDRLHITRIEKDIKKHEKIFEGIEKGIELIDSIIKKYNGNKR